MRLLRASAALAAAVFLAASPAALPESRVLVAPVTQVQGLAFFRSSVVVSNVGSAGRPLRMTFTYRSPVDFSLQAAVVPPGGLSSNTLFPRRTFHAEDVVAYFKTQGAIRSADLAQQLFGTLLVVCEGADPGSCPAVVRTYSAAAEGGTNGIAYVGSELSSASFATNRMALLLRNGSFGQEGSIRSNLGAIHAGSAEAGVQDLGPISVRLSFYDGDSGARVGSQPIFTLQPLEVIQWNGVFTRADFGIPAGTDTIVVFVDRVAGSARMTGYGVELDNESQDGSYFTPFLLD